jgi:hypothetical protein
VAGMLERASCVICAHCGHVINIDDELLRSVLEAQGVEAWRHARTRILSERRPVAKPKQIEG